MVDKVNLQNGFSMITEYWDPHIAAELNGQHVKLAKLKGEFVWHKHDNEDELFYVVKGQLLIELRDSVIELNEGEMAAIPKGIEHRPVAREEVQVLLFEPASTINTGDNKGELTKEQLKHL